MADRKETFADSSRLNIYDHASIKPPLTSNAGTPSGADKVLQQAIFSGRTISNQSNTPTTHNTHNAAQTSFANKSSSIPSDRVPLLAGEIKESAVGSATAPLPAGNSHQVTPLSEEVKEVKAAAEKSPEEIKAHFEKAAADKPYKTKKGIVLIIVAAAIAVIVVLFFPPAGLFVIGLVALSLTALTSFLYGIKNIREARNDENLRDWESLKNHEGFQAFISNIRDTPNYQPTFKDLDSGPSATPTLDINNLKYNPTIIRLFSETEKAQAELDQNLKTYQDKLTKKNLPEAKQAFDKVLSSYGTLSDIKIKLNEYLRTNYQVVENPNAYSNDINISMSLRNLSDLAIRAEHIEQMPPIAFTSPTFLSNSSDNTYLSITLNSLNRNYTVGNGPNRLDNQSTDPILFNIHERRISLRIKTRKLSDDYIRLQIKNQKPDTDPKDKIEGKQEAKDLLKEIKSTVQLELKTLLEEIAYMEKQYNSVRKNPPLELVEKLEALTKFVQDVNEAAVDDDKPLPEFPETLITASESPQMPEVYGKDADEKILMLNNEIYLYHSQELYELLNPPPNDYQKVLKMKPEEYRPYNSSFEMENSRTLASMDPDSLSNEIIEVQLKIKSFELQRDYHTNLKYAAAPAERNPQSEVHADESDQKIEVEASPVPVQSAAVAVTPQQSIIRPTASQPQPFNTTVNIATFTKPTARGFAIKAALLEMQINTLTTRLAKEPNNRDAINSEIATKTKAFKELLNSATIMQDTRGNEG